MDDSFAYSVAEELSEKFLEELILFSTGVSTPPNHTRFNIVKFGTYEHALGLDQCFRPKSLFAPPFSLSSTLFITDNLIEFPTSL